MEAAWPVLFDAVDLGLILVGPDSRVLLWNDWIERRSAIAASDALGKPLKQAFGVPLSAPFESALNNVLRYKLPVVLSNVLHRSPLPLYAQTQKQPPEVRLPHAITLTPLEVPARGSCCLIQVSDPSRAISRERILQKNTEKLHREVMTDSLTQALSRGYFDRMYQQEFAQAQRLGTRLSLILIDVDLFKQYNDTYGHVAGDKVLVALVEALQGALMRSTDKLARYGGEEFVVVLPDCAQGKAMELAEALRQKVQALHLPHTHPQAHEHVTISLGVSTLGAGQICTAQALLEAADHALYAAKKRGRNAVEYSAVAQSPA